MAACFGGSWDSIMMAMVNPKCTVPWKVGEDETEVQVNDGVH